MKTVVNRGDRVNVWREILEIGGSLFHMDHTFLQVFFIFIIIQQVLPYVVWQMATEFFRNIEYLRIYSTEERDSTFRDRFYSPTKTRLPCGRSNVKILP